MMTAEKPSEARGSPDLAAPSEQAKYLLWVAEKVRGEAFWLKVKEDLLEDFANLLNRELPDDLWNAAYLQRDGKDYLIAFEAIVERLQDHCGRLARRG